MGRKSSARDSLRKFVKETLENARNLRKFSVQDVAQAGQQVERGVTGAGTFTRWAVVFLIIFVLFFLLIPDLEERDEDQS